MKALQILENDNIFDERYISENIFYKEEIKEAIKELEELENRNCGNCKHYKQSSHQIYKTCFLIKTNGFNLESNVDFYCNRWEK